HMEVATFGAGASRDFCQCFKSMDKLRPAIRIAAVIDRVCPDEDFLRREYFRPGKSIGKKNCVPRRDMGDRNLVSHFCFRTAAGNFEIGGQGGDKKTPEINFGDPMRMCA